MKMLKKIRSKVSNLLNVSIANKNFFSVLFAFFFLFSIFVTFICLSPVLSERGFSSFSMIFWFITFVIGFFANYKNVLNCFLNLLCILLPLILYISALLLFKIPLIKSQAVFLFFADFLLVCIGYCAKTIFTKQGFNLIEITIYISSFLLSFFIIVLKLLPNISNLSNVGYVYGSKNLTFPLLISSASLFVLKTKKHNFISFLYFILIVVLAFLLKCRTVIFIVPFLFFFLLFKKASKKFFYISLVAFILFLLITFCVPYFYKNIILKFVFNSKTDLDSIFSGRFSLVIRAFQNNSLFSVNPSFYVDCMPVLLLFNLGLPGLLLCLPFVMLPFLLIIKTTSQYKDVLISFVIVFYIDSITEGFGAIGPGSKVFLLWLTVGFTLTPSLFPFSFFHNTNFLNLNHLRPKTFFSFSSIFLFLFSLVIFAVPSSINSISQVAISKFDSFGKNFGYVYPSDVKFSDDNKTLFCVGQKYKFNVNVFPKNVSDSSVQPLAWGCNENEVSFEHGDDVVALFKQPKSFIMQVFTQKATKINDKLGIKVLPQDDFPFDDIQIWTNKYAQETIYLNLNESIPILYDNNYIPNLSLLDFTLSNDFCSIDGNVLTGVSPGVTTLFARGSNNKSSSISNVLTVVVEADSKVNPIDAHFNLNANNFYTNTKYLWDVNSLNTSRDDYFLIVDNNCLDDCELVFATPGFHNIKCVYKYNKNFILFDSNIFVEKLVALNLSLNTNRYKPSPVPYKLPLIAHYNDDSYRPICIDDLEYSYENSDNRATNGSIGIVNNSLLDFYAYKNGNRTLSYKLKETKMEFSFNLIVSTFSEAEFRLALTYVGIIIGCFVSFFAAFSLKLSHDNGLNKKYTYLICLIYFFFVIIAFALTGFSLFKIVISLLILISLIFVIIANKYKLCIINYKEINIKDDLVCVKRINI